MSALARGGPRHRGGRWKGARWFDAKATRSTSSACCAGGSARGHRLADLGAPARRGPALPPAPRGHKTPTQPCEPGPAHGAPHRQRDGRQISQRYPRRRRLGDPGHLAPARGVSHRGRPRALPPPWRIELAFKRLKSLIGLMAPPGTDERSARPWVPAHLLIILLLEPLVDELETLPAGLPPPDPARSVAVLSPTRRDPPRRSSHSPPSPTATPQHRLATARARTARHEPTKRCVAYFSAYGPAPGPAWNWPAPSETITVPRSRPCAASSPTTRLRWRCGTGWDHVEAGDARRGQMRQVQRRPVGEVLVRISGQQMDRSLPDR